MEPETDGDDTKTSKSNKKQKKRKTKTKGLSDEMEDTENDSDLSKDRSNGVTDGSRETSIARLQISASYVPSSGQLFVYIHQGENLASGGPGFIPCFEVRITLLPSKIQRFKTKPQSSANPIFDEFFTFDEVFPEDVQVGSLRARVYRLHGRKRSLVGEMKTELSADLELEEQNVENKWREITPADQIADDISDTVLVTDPEAALMAPKETVPMLQVSLQHKCITGKLNVEIIKARHMKTLTIQKAPETFVQVALLNSHGNEIANGKTSVCKGSFHPVFEETFYLPAIEFELPDLTVIFSVYCKRFRRKELIGWFGIGRESTGEREQLHWDEMIGSRGEPIKGWYTLNQG